LGASTGDALVLGSKHDSFVKNDDFTGLQLLKGGPAGGLLRTASCKQSASAVISIFGEVFDLHHKVDSCPLRRFVGVIFVVNVDYIYCSKLHHSGDKPWEGVIELICKFNLTATLIVAAPLVKSIFFKPDIKRQGRAVTKIYRWAACTDGAQVINTNKTIAIFRDF